MKMTLAAQAQLKKLFTPSVSQQDPLVPASMYFRISVMGGGCSGFQYEYTLAEQKNLDDILLEYPQHDLGFCQGLVIDEISYEYLQSAELDYQKDFHGQKFIIHNDKAQSVCGCGRSVSF